MSDLFDNYGTDPSAVPNQPPLPAERPDLFANYSADGQPPPDAPLPMPALLPATPPTTPSIEPPPSLEAVFAELQHLVGLQDVKNELMRLRQFAQVQELRRAKNLGVMPFPRHAVFYGTPGSGKTTIARLYGQILRALGVLSRGQLVETDRLGLVSSMAGRTADNTNRALQRAQGGVLFVDDAQVLARDEYNTWDPGTEVIQILLERISDPTLDVAVILGGYPDAMQKLIQSHDGMKNLFANHLYFVPYSATELQEIFERLCAEKQYDLIPAARDEASRIISGKSPGQQEAFSNARFVYNLFQTVTRNQAMRLSHHLDSVTESDLRELQAVDITLPEIPGMWTARPIGFDRKTD